MLGIAGFQPGDTDDEKIDKLEALLFERKNVPIYAELLGVDASKRYGHHGLSSELPEPAPAKPNPQLELPF